MFKKYFVLFKSEVVFDFITNHTHIHNLPKGFVGFKNLIIFSKGQYCVINVTCIKK